MRAQGVLEFTFNHKRGLTVSRNVAYHVRINFLKLVCANQFPNSNVVLGAAVQMRNLPICQHQNSSSATVIPYGITLFQSFSYLTIFQFFIALLECATFSQFQHFSSRLSPSPTPPSKLTSIHYLWKRSRTRPKNVEMLVELLYRVKSQGLEIATKRTGRSCESGLHGIHFRRCDKPYPS